MVFPDPRPGWGTLRRSCDRRPDRKNPPAIECREAPASALSENRVARICMNSLGLGEVMSAPLNWYGGLQADQSPPGVKKLFTSPFFDFGRRSYFDFAASGSSTGSTGFPFEIEIEKISRSTRVPERVWISMRVPRGRSASQENRAEVLAPAQFDEIGIHHQFRNEAFPVQQHFSESRECSQNPPSSRV